MYEYFCFDCNAVYSPGEIENELLYLCPKCGSLKENEPLRGVLLIRYDYDSLKKKISKENFLRLTPGRIWDYPELLPLKHDCARFHPERIALSAAPVHERTYNGKKLMLFDDTGNPTLSYKDRATTLVALKALEMGIAEIAAASTGNAGSSLAGIGARMGIKTHLFCPARIPEGKRLQIQAFGAQLYLVDGSYDDAFDTSLDISRKKRWYNRNTAYNPLTIEGKKSSVFDMFIQLGGKLPDQIYVPTGDGVIIGGIYRGCIDLLQLGWIEKLPQLIAVQSSAGDALKRFIDEGKFEFVPANTAADSISAGAPRNLYHAAQAVRSTSGTVIAVDDEKIFEAQKIAAREFGILIEPAAAASFAGYLKFAEENPDDKLIPMLMFTGNGLKDLAALRQWNPELKPRSKEEWNAYFE
jgi:threonine synthase